MSRPDGSRPPSYRAVTLWPGSGRGEALVLTEPLNIWGGLDPATGRITHGRHPQRDACVAGRVLVLPASRGSGTNAQVFAQACAAGVGPAAVLLLQRDLVLTVGAAVAGRLYGVDCPVVMLAADDYRRVTSGDTVEVLAARPYGQVWNETAAAAQDPQ